MRAGGGSPARAFEPPDCERDDMSSDVKTTSTHAPGENGTRAVKDADSTASENHSIAAASRKRKLSCGLEDRLQNQQHAASAPDFNFADRHHSPGGQKKRRYSHHYHHKNGADRFTKRPNRFLLGGNVTDPLNLNALCADTEAGRALNEVTPRSSPLPLPQHRMLVDVIVPANINDPLNLNVANGDETPSGSVLSRRTKRKKHKKKSEKLPEHAANLSAAAAVQEPVKPLDARPADGAVADACTDGTFGQPTTMPAVLVGNAVTVGDSTAQLLYPTPKPSVSAAPAARVVGPTSQLSVNRGQTSRGENKDAAPAVQQCHNRRKFIYGNYTSYYAYRNPEFADDCRLAHFNKDWFAGKDVLDIGCNTGHITMTVARDHNPRSVVGIDIDPQLISLARKNMRFYIKDRPVVVYPSSMATCYGPLAAPVATVSCTGLFPNNVRFMQANYSLERDELLDLQREEYDVILALSITKWLHLHHGDAGIKRAFKRMYKQLRPGGRLILEPQQFPSYKRRKNLTVTIRKNYEAIQFRPEQFSEYLLSKEVGFTTCEEINVESNKSKGFRRPLFVFTKAVPETSQKPGQSAVSSESPAGGFSCSSAASAVEADGSGNCSSSNAIVCSTATDGQPAVNETHAALEDAKDFTVRHADNFT